MGSVFFNKQINEETHVLFCYIGSIIINIIYGKTTWNTTTTTFDFHSFHNDDDDDDDHHHHLFIVIINDLLFSTTTKNLFVCLFWIKKTIFFKNSLMMWSTKKNDWLFCDKKHIGINFLMTDFWVFLFHWLCVFWLWISLTLPMFWNNDVDVPGPTSLIILWSNDWRSSSTTTTKVIGKKFLCPFQRLLQM